jgi:hypothetical protein
LTHDACCSLHSLQLNADNVTKPMRMLCFSLLEIPFPRLGV